VVKAALLLVDEGGTEALTMRRLAGELGVATTTIYWHVGSRDDVVDAVIQPEEIRRELIMRLRYAGRKDRSFSERRHGVPPV